MEKREIMLYVITIISFMALMYIIFGAFLKIPTEKINLFSGNVILDLKNNLHIGDSLEGELEINSKENSEAYGLVLLSKDDKPIVTETFNLNEILRKDSDSKGQTSIKIKDLIQYKFKEKGDYELLFSVLDLNINIKKEILVE